MGRSQGSWLLGIDPGTWWRLGECSVPPHSLAHPTTQAFPYHERTPWLSRADTWTLNRAPSPLRTCSGLFPAGGLDPDTRPRPPRAGPAPTTRLRQASPTRPSTWEARAPGGSTGRKRAAGSQPPLPWCPGWMRWSPDPTLSSDSAAEGMWVLGSRSAEDGALHPSDLRSSRRGPPSPRRRPEPEPAGRPWPDGGSGRWLGCGRRHPSLLLPPGRGRGRSRAADTRAADGTLKTQQGGGGEPGWSVKRLQVWFFHFLKAFYLVYFMCVSVLPHVCNCIHVVHCPRK